MIIFTLTFLCIIFWIAFTISCLKDVFRFARWTLRQVDRFVITPLAWIIVLPFRGLGAKHGR